MKTNKDLYVCIKDYQSGSFGMYRAYTIEEWREQALEWCDSDDNEELYNTLKTLPSKYVIDYINDIWQIEIVKINEKQKDDIIKYIVAKSNDFGFYNIIINELKNKMNKDDEYYNEKIVTLESLKELINTLESKIYEVENENN